MNLICNVDEFMCCHEKDLASVEHLYFANQNIRSLLQNFETRDKIFSRLKLCVNLKKINLSNSQLRDQDCIEITAAIVSKHIEYVNLRDTNLSKENGQFIEIKFKERNPSIICIANGSISQPQPYCLQSHGWVLKDTWYEIEIFEMLTVAEELLKKHPYITKAHGYRNTLSKTLASDSISEIQSTLPWSVLFIDGKALLLPKLSFTPEQISDFNSRMRQYRINHLDADPDKPLRNIKLAIHRSIYSACSLETSLIKSSSAMHNSPSINAYIKRERNILDDYGLCPLYLKRVYKQTLANTLAFKAYIIMPLYLSQDAFKLLGENVTFIPISGTHFDSQPEAFAEKIPLMERSVKETSLAFTLQALLAIMLMHSRDIIHNDIKPENFIINIEAALPTERMQVHLIDFEGATVLGEDVGSPILKHRRFTDIYMPPEIKNSLVPPPDGAQDAFSYGIMARQFLFPYAAWLYGNEYLFNLPPLGSANYSRIFDFLASFFKAGISRNYGAKFAEIISGLYEQSPANRIRLPTAFLEMAKIYPDAALDAYRTTYNILHQTLEQTLNSYPTARQILHQACPNFYTSSNEITTVDISAINALYRLNLLNFFLELYKSCNNVLPPKTENILIRDIKDLFERADINDPNKLDMSFYNEHEIYLVIKRHRDYMRLVLNEFSYVSLIGLHSGLSVETPYIQKLLQIQVKIWQMWDEKRGVSAIASFAYEQLQSIMKQTELPQEVGQLSQRLHSNLELIVGEVSSDSNKRVCVRPY